MQSSLFVSTSLGWSVPGMVVRAMILFKRLWNPFMWNIVGSFILAIGIWYIKAVSGKSRWYLGSRGNLVNITSWVYLNYGTIYSVLYPNFGLVENYERRE